MAHIHSHLLRHCAPQRKKSPFVCRGWEWGRSLGWTAERLCHSSRHHGDRTSHPSLASTPLIPASAHKHRLISDTTITAVIVSSCYLIGSVCIIALKTSPTMASLLSVLIASAVEFFKSVASHASAISIEMHEKNLQNNIKYHFGFIMWAKHFHLKVYQ